MSDTPQRRFSETEAREVFHRAALEQERAAQQASSDGLTYAEMVEIGEAAGIASEHVAAAVAGLSAEPEPLVPTWRGVPLVTRRTRFVPNEVSETEWGRMVGLLRQEFGATGYTDQIGDRREWRHDHHQTLIARVTAEDSEGGTRLTVGSGTGTSPLVARLLAAVWIMISGLCLMAGIVDDTLLVGGGLAATFALLALLSYVGLFAHAKQQSRTRPVHYDALLDRLELLARSEETGRGGPARRRLDRNAEASAIVPPPEPSLRLDPGDEPLSPSAPSPTRTRA